MLFLLINLIGTQPYCTIDLQTKQIECNYESLDVCEGYRASNERCIENPNFKR